MCACKITFVLFSKPLVAGFLKIKLPIASSVKSIECCVANSRKKARTFSSFFEGRGTAFKFSKLFQRMVGCNFLTSCDMSLIFVCC